ncbi:MAG: ATP-dependent metalloprotease [Legionellales bacterium]|nr:MAG: ATP-dependent metalloprotease [Legionellales bacterium]
MKNMIKNVVLWLVIAIVLMSVFGNFNQKTQLPNLSYSQFITKVKNGEVKQVTIGQDKRITGITQNAGGFTSFIPSEAPFLLEELVNNGVDVIGKPPEQQSMLLHIFISWFPILLFIGVWIFVIRQMNGGSSGRGGPLSFGRSKAKMLSDSQIKTTFKDVAGVDEAKTEVGELVEFLSNPKKFQKLGGKIPRGVLMVGPPGTGKTLLAKAIAGESKVPFFTISGSDFVEMFVGVGASRVRDMFARAKKHAPCIIFIDEIDAVGRHRGSGMGGGHDEREQTLNQLLVEMDGFEGNEGVIVIAATNRADVLDKALLRPGRFDRQVHVSLPDIKGREQILKVHLRKVPVADNAKAMVIARGTPGFSGADLANLVNEAALFAARNDKRVVDMGDLEHAKDKLIMGVERRSLVMSEQERKLTAYHEAGHALVGLLLPEIDPVYKVTIIPRAGALGVTFFLPETDKYSYSKKRLESQLAVAFGGRIAEEIIFGADYVTTGASNDIEQASKIARNMVTRWGLSDKLSPLIYVAEEQESFFGPSSSNMQLSAATTQLIDSEIKQFIDVNYANAKQLIEGHMEELHAMAEALLQYETIDKFQLKNIMAGNPAGEPRDWQNDSDDDSTDATTKSKQSKKSKKSKATDTNSDAVGAGDTVG